MLDDGSPNALVRRIKNLESDPQISIDSHESTYMNGDSNLMNHLFVNDLMGIFHFTDGQNAHINEVKSGNGYNNPNDQITDT